MNEQFKYIRMCQDLNDHHNNIDGNDGNDGSHGNYGNYGNYGNVHVCSRNILFIFIMAIQIIYKSITE